MCYRRLFVGSNFNYIIPGQLSIFNEIFKNKTAFSFIMVNPQQAEDIYQKIKGQLKGQEGSMVAIDTDTGDYFIGKNAIEAFKKGRKKYPHKEFFFKRVGAKTAYHIGYSQ